MVSYLIKCIYFGDVGNQWVEYDAPTSQHTGVTTVNVSEHSAHSPAIKALLDINTGQQVKIKELSQLPPGVQVQQSEVYIGKKHCQMLVDIVIYLFHGLVIYNKSAFHVYLLIVA